MLSINPFFWSLMHTLSGKRRSQNNVDGLCKIEARTNKFLVHVCSWFMFVLILKRPFEALSLFCVTMWVMAVKVCCVASLGLRLSKVTFWENGFLVWKISLDFSLLEAAMSKRVFEQFVREVFSRTMSSNQCCEICFCSCADRSNNNFPNDSFHSLYFLGKKNTCDKVGLHVHVRLSTSGRVAHREDADASVPSVSSNTHANQKDSLPTAKFQHIEKHWW